MKILLTIFLLFLPSFVLGEDITEFEIEGMSVGDSLLDYYTETEINNAPKTIYPNSDKYYQIVLQPKNKTQYNDYSIGVKKGDTTYTIKLLSGLIYFDDSIDRCLNHKDMVFKDISSMFSKNQLSEYEYIYDTLADGKSIAYISDFELVSGFIRIYCIEYSDATKNEIGFMDSFSIDITSLEYINWINDEAY
tara:strand:+ start:56 stop:631 length:576 start_codon:yes stop_codon:yes gene_type:complete